MTNLICSLILGALFFTNPVIAQDSETHVPPVPNEVYTPLFVNMHDGLCLDNQHAQREFDGLLFRLEDQNTEVDRNIDESLIQSLWDLSSLNTKSENDEKTK
tara:strand:+ start:104 stop:409 length:306 start_codon:yes stop_codon:yes gene_type:complete